MTEFQGWLMLAMGAFLVASIMQHGGRTPEGRVFAVIGIILAGVGLMSAL